MKISGSRRLEMAWGFQDPWCAKVTLGPSHLSCKKSGSDEPGELPAPPYLAGMGSH